MGASLAEAGALGLWKAVCIGAALAIGLTAAVGARFLIARKTEAHRRGAVVHVPWSMRRQGGSRRARSKRTRPRRTTTTVMRLGGVAFTEEDETRHFKLIGTTGTGKSTAIAELLRTALVRGDRAVIADPNGAYTARFHDRYRGDLLLNPFEPHSARWDLHAEARRPFDYEELARGLIPDSEDASGREWRGYARTLVAAVARRCGSNGGPQVGELWRLLATADGAELRRHVAGTPAQPFLDPENARMFGSIRAVAVSALGALQHIAAQRGPALSVRDWVACGRGALFIPYRADQVAALRSLISTWVRLAIFETMSGPHRGRLWFIVDELDALGPIDGLKDALARLRKFGGRCVLGFQSVAQVSSTYGAGDAQTIVENCGNTLILRCSGSEPGGTSAFASRLIGEREIVRRQVSRSRDARELFSRGDRRRSTQIAHQSVTEAAVLPAEIEQLPDLTGYLKTASCPRWTLIRIAADAADTRPWPSTISG